MTASTSEGGLFFPGQVWRNESWRVVVQRVDEAGARVEASWEEQLGRSPEPARHEVQVRRGNGYEAGYLEGLFREYAFSLEVDSIVIAQPDREVLQRQLSFVAPEERMRLILEARQWLDKETVTDLADRFLDHNERRELKNRLSGQTYSWTSGGETKQRTGPSIRLASIIAVLLALGILTCLYFALTVFYGG